VKKYSNILNNDRISGSLLIIVKLLMHINESVTSSDFPGFLDNQSRDFFIRKAKFEMQND